MSYKLLVQSAFRLLVSIPVPLAAAFFFNYFNHKSYYATIRSTQTVDFNILANTLPTKLSLSLRDGDYFEIQQTINSNYGLFGIIVTDCKEDRSECLGEQIIATSKPEREGWADSNFPRDLVGQPFNLLRDPPPKTAEWQYENPVAISPVSTGRVNPGAIIGRVYYIRRNPPNFLENQVKWLFIPRQAIIELKETGNLQKSGSILLSFANKGPNKYFFLTNLLGLLVAIVIWQIWQRFSYSRRMQEDLYQRKEKEFNSKNIDKNKRIESLTNQVLDLEVKLLNKKQDEDSLCRELSFAKNEIEESRKKLDTLSNEFSRAKAESEYAREGNQDLIDQLASAKEQSEETSKLISFLKSQLDTIQNSTDIERKELQLRLSQAIEESYKNEENTKELSRKLNNSSEILFKKQEDFRIISESLLIAQENLNQKEYLISDLQDNLNSILAREGDYLKKIEQLKGEAKRLEQDKLKLKELREKDCIGHKKTIEKILEEQNKFLDSQANENNSLLSKNNELETQVLELIRLNEDLECKLALLSSSSELEDDNIILVSSLSFATVSEALYSADKNLPNLEIWESAFQSALKIDRYQPDRVYSSLVALDEAGHAYFGKTMDISIQEFLKSRKCIYTPRESPSTLNRYGEERFFRNKGETRQMFKHLKIGRKLRIYIEFDEEKNKVLIGYCGKHLNTVTG